MKSASSPVPLGDGGEVQLVAGRGAEQLAVESGGDPALTDLVQPVLGVQPDDGLAVALGRQGERHLVAGLHRTVDVGERTVALDLGGDRLLDVVLGRVQRRQLDAQAAVTVER